MSGSVKRPSLADGSSKIGQSETMSQTSLGCISEEFLTLADSAMFRSYNFDGLQAKHPVSKVIDILSDIIEQSDINVSPSISRRRVVSDLDQLEKATIDVIQCSSEPELLRILKDYGWTGAKFRPPELHSLYAQEQCLKALKNFYLRNHDRDASAEIHSRKLVAAFTKSETDNKLALIYPFCPGMLLKHLSENKIDMLNPAGIPKSFSFDGACMLADISGFSKFSGAMCAKGVGGLDGLREATNGFLAHFVKVVYEHHGDGTSCVVGWPV
jgi:hypothetical protein